MKKTLLATTLLMSSGFIFAAEQTSDHKDHHSDSATTMTQEKTGMSAENMPMMQAMRSQMMEINQTVDPDKRDELIQAHMANMRKMMQEMHGDSNAMMGQSMDMSDGTMGDKEKKMMEMMNQQGMMGKRMNMMLMMMDQMMQNLAASEETHVMRTKRHDHMTMK